MDLHFAINENLDRAAIAARFREHGRVEIRDFLSSDAAGALRAHLLERSDWQLVLKAAAGVYEIPRSRFGELSDQQKQELEDLVIRAARQGFQYRYESIRVPDGAPERNAIDTPLDRFVEFLGSEPALAFFREILGTGALCFADGQATSYSPGHFLTRHDDAVEGKNRLAAYVLGLQPDWQPEWGGLLMFHGRDGNIEEAFTPAMGALRLFQVPAPHSVSYVNPIAPTPRISITGWFRTQRP